MFFFSHNKFLNIYFYFFIFGILGLFFCYFLLSQLPFWLQKWKFLWILDFWIFIFFHFSSFCGSQFEQSKSVERNRNGGRDLVSKRRKDFVNLIYNEI